MEKNCGFCGSSGCEQVDDTFREQLADMLDTLLLDSATLRRNGLACDECAEKVTKAFQFKQNWTLMETHSSILDENAKCCQLCRDILKADAAVPLMNLVEDDGVKTVLQRHLPEVNLEQIRNLEVCDTCEKHLTDIKSLFFLSDCLELRHKALEIVKLEDRFASTADQCMEIEEACFGNDAMIKTEIQDEEIERIEYVTVEDLKVFAEAGGSGPGVKVEPEDEGTELKQEEIDIKSEDERSDGHKMDLKQVGSRRNLKRKTRARSKHVSQGRSNEEESKVFTCDLCQFSALKKQLLDRHRLICKHKNEGKIYRCLLCSFESKHSKNFQYHMFSKHDDTSNANIITCASCGFKTIHKSRLKRHMITHNRTKLKCASCSFETKNKHTLQGHVVLKHGKTSANVMTCELCDYKTLKEADLEKHLNKHSGQRGHKCKLCWYATKFEVTFQRHMATKHGTTQFLACDFCKYKTSKRARFKRHLMTHADPLEDTGNDDKNETLEFKSEVSDFECLKTENSEYLEAPDIQNDSGVDVYKCELKTEPDENVSFENSNVNAEKKSDKDMYKCTYTHCTFESKSNKGLRCHLSLKHGEAPKILSCELCDFKTLKSYHMNVHTMKHAKEKSYKCGCGYETKYEKSLQGHMLLRHKSEDEKVLKCELCDYRCLQPSVLKGHMFKHGIKSEAKAFKCECGYEARNDKGLRSHLVLRHDHADPEVIKCPFCDYKCLKPHAMRKHVAVHSNKMPAQAFVCELCGFVSKYSHGLKRHMILKHGETKGNMYVCDICHHKTLFKKNMDKHMKVHS